MNSFIKLAIREVAVLKDRCIAILIFYSKYKFLSISITAGDQIISCVSSVRCNDGLNWVNMLNDHIFQCIRFSFFCSSVYMNIPVYMIQAVIQCVDMELTVFASSQITNRFSIIGIIGNIYITSIGSQQMIAFNCFRILERTGKKIKNSLYGFRKQLVSLLTQRRIARKCIKIRKKVTQFRLHGFGFKLNKKFNNGIHAPFSGTSEISQWIAAITLYILFDVIDRIIQFLQYIIR